MGYEPEPERLFDKPVQGRGNLPPPTSDRCHYDKSGVCGAYDTKKEKSTMIGKMTSAAVAAMMLCATSAHALGNCSVQIDQKTGVLVVSARAVTGP